MPENKQPTLQEAAEAARCPDCTADVTVIEVSPGVYRGQVAHDDTCPWWLAFQARCPEDGAEVRLFTNRKARRKQKRTRP